jgi:hypothetical protein
MKTPQSWWDLSKLGEVWEGRVESGIEYIKKAEVFQLKAKKTGLL